MHSEDYVTWVCLSVCLLSHISHMERLFILKTLSRTQWATKVKIFVGFSLKPLHCRDPECTVGHSSCRKLACVLKHMHAYSAKCATYDFTVLRQEFAI